MMMSILVTLTPVARVVMEIYIISGCKYSW